MRSVAKPALVLAYIVAAPFLWVGLSSLVFLAGTQLWGHPDIPRSAYLWQWLEYRHDFGLNALTSLWLVASGVLVALALLVPLIRMAKMRGSKRKLFGESHFATENEARKSGLVFSHRPLGNAFLLGRTQGFGRRYVSLPGEEHVSLYARTRSGKGVSVVVPNALNWGGSLIAFSIKRDLVRDAAAERARKGQAVFVFDPTNPDGRSHRWNPLGNVPRGGVGCYDAVQRVMQFVIPETKANNPFWDNAGRRIATAAAVLLAETPGAALNIAGVKRLLGRSDYDKHFRQMIAEARNEARPYSASAVDTILGWLDRKGEEGANGVRDTALTAMALWDSEVIAAATEVSDFDLAALRREPMSVFVCAEVADIRRLRPLFALFFQQLVDFNTRREFSDDPRHRYQVAVEMDEFWAPGRMDILADAAAFTASFGFRLLYVVQSKQQLHSIYGEQGAENIFLNTGAELLFGGADQKLAEEVSKRAGADTVTETTTNRPRFFGWLSPARQSESEAVRQRALMLPQEVQRLSRDEMLVLRPGLPPLKLARVVWFKDSFFRGMKGAPPPVPQLHLRVERDDPEAIARAQAESQVHHERAKEEAAARAEAEFAEVEKAAAEAAIQAKSAGEVERVTEAEVLVRVREAATAQEVARLARQAATEAKKDAKAWEEAASARAVAVAKVAEAVDAAARATSAAAVAQDAAGQASRRAAEARIDAAEARRASKVPNASLEVMEAVRAKQEAAVAASTVAATADAEQTSATSAAVEARQAVASAKARLQAIEAQQGDLDISAQAQAAAHAKAQAAAEASTAATIAAAEAQQAVANAKSDLSLARRDAAARKRRAEHLGRVLDKMRPSASHPGG
ncbi:type IV secretory system conjugative DNA transfer family protein [Roseomonas sp. KE2513]|uniref:type IV secretory system conjugative DNA transfer family protein n=1 Tax=Roseomonas sp. KE2513 TaxID=2479202 RepID=UPI0018DFC8AC|nr:type IV secretory system conjugative DNA transfer family protein [Roseomonas sp. KE2513]MBI0537712.1 type IV secretory system conjugative DNA transfer family protein [Roseomonas sp. KE2513]